METTQTQTNVKKPKLGDRPKRGIKNMVLKIVKKDATFRPHHQKTLLIELLEFKQGEASVEDLVQLIEADEAKWARLDTIQSPYNCVVYHAKQLADAGYLKIETISAPGQVETREAAPQQLEVIEYSKSKAKRAADSEEQKKLDEQVLEVVTEIMKDVEETADTN